MIIALQNGVSLIGVESVDYPKTLAYWFSFFMRQLGISHIRIVELSPHGRSKESRIRNFVSELYKETYYIHEAAARRAFTWQGSMYKFGKKANKDDILDAVAYGMDVRNDYWHLVHSLSNSATMIDHNLCSVEHNSCF